MGVGQVVVPPTGPLLNCRSPAVHKAIFLHKCAKFIFAKLKQYCDSASLSIPLQGDDGGAGSADCEDAMSLFSPSGKSGEAPHEEMLANPPFIHTATHGGVLTMAHVSRRCPAWRRPQPHSLHQPDE